MISIYNVLGKLVERVGPLVYEDTICDLLYQLKYMFVGYTIKNELEQAIEKFPKSMREKLKFLLAHSTTAENVHQQTTQQHHQQVISGNSSSQQPAQQPSLPPASFPPTFATEHAIVAANAKQ